MKKVLLFFLLSIFSITSFAQVPYWGATVGEGKIYGYTSVKFRPGVNAMQNYTTLQFGITDWFSLGTDLSVGKDYSDHGLYARIGKKWNKWISAGTQVSYMSDMRDNYKFSNVNAGLLFNGFILPSGYLTWTSNTWMTFNRGGNHNYEHWLYLGSNIVFNDKHSLFPMIGIVHDWKFQQPVDLAVGAWYTYKNYSFYLWGNDFFKENPRVTVAVDFTF